MDLSGGGLRAVSWPNSPPFLPVQCAALMYISRIPRNWASYTGDDGTSDTVLKNLTLCVILSTLFCCFILNYFTLLIGLLFTNCSIVMFKIANGNGPC